MAGLDPALGHEAEPVDTSGTGAQRRGHPIPGAAYLSNRRVLIGLGVIGLLAVICFAGPLVYHTSLTHTNLGEENLPPGSGHILGTDIYGTDVLWRLMGGGRASLELSLAVAIASTGIGALYGAISGLAGGLLDGLMMRIVDVFLSAPTLVLLIIAASLFSLDLGTIIVVLSLLSWPSAARLVRAQALVLGQRDYVQAAVGQGASRWWVLRKHVLPNTSGIIVVAGTFAVADAVYELSALSFLGLGPQPPFADWGTLLTQGVDNLFNGYWWQVYPPLFALVITVLAVRQIGDAVNDMTQAGVSEERTRRRGRWLAIVRGGRVGAAINS